MQKIRLDIALGAGMPTLAALEAKFAKFHYACEVNYRGRNPEPRRVPCIFTVPRNVSAAGLRREVADFLFGGDGALIARLDKN